MTPLLSPLTRRVPSGFHAVDNTRPLHISNEMNQRKREHESSSTSALRESSSCGKGWPGLVDSSGYVRKCDAFEAAETLDVS